MLRVRLGARNTYKKRFCGAMAKWITWWQAAEILGISDRWIRRRRERYRSTAMTPCSTGEGETDFDWMAVECWRSTAAVPGELSRLQLVALPSEAGEEHR